MAVKEKFLNISKWMGLFQLARLCQGSGLRILCYHGFALADEADFRPKLFIRPETFETRLRFIKKQGFQVLCLEEANEMLSKAQLPSHALVITIDDGFYSVYSAGAPLLRKFALPATVYVTTYYCLKQTPIFRLAMQYMFWKTTTNQLDLSGLTTPQSAIVCWQDIRARDSLMWDLIRFGEVHLTEERRVELAREIGVRLHVDYDSLNSQRYFTLMSLEELRELLNLGFDLQLHTHRHQLSEEGLAIRREINQNRDVLEPLAGKPLEHLCYPSGVWSKRMWASLQDLGIRSATTCEPGLNQTSTPKLGLKRFLDGENISQIEFEAEMCGFSDFLRAVRGFFNRVHRGKPLAATAPLDAGLSHGIKH